MSRATRALSRSLDMKLRNEVGKISAQWRVFRILTKTHDDISQKEIAECRAFEAPTLIPILDKLEKDGFN